MGLIDSFCAEDMIEVKFSDFYKLVENSTRAEMMLNGIKNEVDHDAIHRVVTGKPLREEVKESEEK